MDLFFAKAGIFSKFFTHLKMLNRASAAHQTNVIKKGVGVGVTPRSQTTRVTGTRTSASWRRRRLCCLLRYSTRLQLGYWEMEGHPVKHNKLVLKVVEISRYRSVLQLQHRLNIVNLWLQFTLTSLTLSKYSEMSFKLVCHLTKAGALHFPMMDS